MLCIERQSIGISQRVKQNSKEMGIKREKTRKLEDQSR